MLPTLFLASMLISIKLNRLTDINCFLLLKKNTAKNCIITKFSPKSYHFIQNKMQVTILWRIIQGLVNHARLIYVYSVLSLIGQPMNGAEMSYHRPVYLAVQFHPRLPDIIGIVLKYMYMPLLNLSVTMNTVVPDLPIISFIQPPNLDRSLTLRQPPSVNDEAPRPSQSCSKSRCNLCLPLI